MFGKMPLEMVLDFSRKWQRDYVAIFENQAEIQLTPRTFLQELLPRIINWYDHRKLFERLEAKDNKTHSIRQMCFILASSRHLDGDELCSSLLATWANDLGKGLLESYQQELHPEMSAFILDSCLQDLGLSGQIFSEAIYATMAHNGYQARTIVGEIDHLINPYPDEIDGQLHRPTVMARKAAQSELMGPYGFVRVMLDNYHYPERFALGRPISSSVLSQIQDQLQSQINITIYNERDFGIVKDLNDKYWSWTKDLVNRVQSIHDLKMAKEDAVSSNLTAWLHRGIGADCSVDNFINMLNNLDEIDRTAWLAGLNLAMELAEVQADLLTEKIGPKLRIIPDSLPVFGSLFFNFLTL
ncbi:MAG TPA: hypothetical protein PLT32_00980 [bacterium]|nr:hypothetical protein [bacterium]